MKTNTYREILQQPQAWLEEYENLVREKDRIAAFLHQYLTPETDVVLTGAGTSAFIGDALCPVLRKQGWSRCRAVSTTDLVTHMSSFLSQSTPLLLISFARSGNSPESVAVVNKANAYCNQVAHIFITCNANGELALRGDEKNTCLILLPKQTNDLSLAMTSSFSTMLLTGCMLAKIDTIETEADYVKATAENAQYILDNCQTVLKSVASSSFSRGIFLGSGELRGIAEECHLKLQELTDGAIVCKFDSFLGFRHGPKAVVKPDSLVVYLITDDEEVQIYERDLIRQVAANNPQTKQIIVSCGKKVNVDVHPTAEIMMPNGSKQTGIYGLVPYVLVGQLLGFNASLAHDLCPDTPSVSGNISRVVEGVTIYYTM
ncbi:MAG: SIS domain-containing protein [Paludibacteraceae bacterium]|nr:SIS domain-containing protein [Paludibacteraceae bacterium]